MALAPNAQDKIEAWRNHCNAERPHSALGSLSPEEFARAAAETETAANNKTKLAILT